MATLLSCTLRIYVLKPPILSGNLLPKRHVRALRRSPVRIIPADRKHGDSQHEASGAQGHVKRAPPIASAVQTVNPVGSQVKPALEFTYDRALPSDKRLSKVVTIAKSKNFRDRHGQVLLEGRRLLMDALEAGAVLQTLFFSRVDNLNEFPQDKLKKVNLVKVKFEDVKIWSDVVAPQGLMGILRKPDHSKMNYPAIQSKHTLPLSLICDNIRDPGNLGTILRCAAGAGCNKVLLTKGCVDPWEPKVLRAGMGAHFRLPIISGLDWDVVPKYLTAGTKVFLADRVRLKSSDETVALSEKASDYGWISSDPRRLSVTEDKYESDEEESGGDSTYIPYIDAQSYHKQWAEDPSAIVIGGETQGLSVESLLLAGKTNGRRLYIAVVPGVDSLNSAMAASILLFEGKRQIEGAKKAK
ncbi:hypothetical protein GDO86_003819 [Hymenochirus boettgeri]|uniref:RNA 2-O ribose methyltransferase substrate binding domain-containing protein n=1 Tax=Hymenochirus boettgeri TaxID=247094 RepID=A0A8T2K2N9_9PIPI|nr:hypothetical protein GDO86_003819 [Hymenochirus boettgeri]